MFQKFISELEEELAKPLPGKDEQIRMAPLPINKSRFETDHNKNVNLGGVMLLLYPDGDRIKFPLTERAKYPGVHSGQISFPGGKIESGDNDIVETAKRETYEEIGVNIESIHVIGKLTELYIPPSNFHVQPSIGYLNEKPIFKEETYEVVKIIETDIATLLDDSIVQRNEVEVNDNLKMDIPYFSIDGHMVWGATAMMLSEFKTILKRINTI